MSHLRVVFSFLLLSVLISPSLTAQQQTGRQPGVIHINTDKGNPLKEGVSGFNVRIADKVWNYTHPDFRDAVHRLHPGWLRFFSGTMGSAFNAATGLYDKDYAWMHDHQQQYFRGYVFTDVKGPHRISDLYALLGEIGGKLVVTINGFTETPEITRELARFCKNNNIEVEVWQFCNEPYFYVPHRDRYWFNDGYDYAVKMKPHAEAILDIFPDARLAVNASWDGVWAFFASLYNYQQKHGAYWDVFSKHSYAPHFGGDEPFDNAMRRANSALIDVTGPEAMQEIENYSWEGVPLLITEFGVWNRPLIGLFSAIYVAEYTLRQLQHPNAFLIGSHEVSNKGIPAIDLNDVIWDAYEQKQPIDTDSLRTGVYIRAEGRALKIVHKATSYADFSWHTTIEGGKMVDGLHGEDLDGLYAMAFKGTNSHDHLLITNRSGYYHDFDIWLDDKLLDEKVKRTFMYSENPKEDNADILEDTVSTSPLNIPPYSVVLIQWEKDVKRPPTRSRIYRAEVINEGVKLDWWERETADHYTIVYGEDPDHMNDSIIINGGDQTSYIVSNLAAEKTYWFAVKATNSAGSSPLSAAVKLSTQAPPAPEIFNTTRRDTTITVFWRSVPGAKGYKVSIKSKSGKYTNSFDAQNVFGYRIDGLDYDVPYLITVAAYNGLGESNHSSPVEVTCKKGIPVPPRNISARMTNEGSVFLNWINQDTINSDIRFKVLRGKELYQFQELASDIADDHFIDTTNDGQSDYYYTVMAYTADGESNFHPNIATVLSIDEGIDIDIVEVNKTDDALLVRVSFDNIPDVADLRFGVSLSDISYLTVEETLFDAKEVGAQDYMVEIPFDELTEGRTYSVKAFIRLDFSFIYSLPPHHNVTINP